MSDETGVLLWEVTKHLILLSPAEAGEGNVPSEGAARRRDSTCKILVCISCCL